MNDDALIPAIFDYAEAMLEPGQVMLPLMSPQEHVFERFVAPPTGDYRAHHYPGGVVGIRGFGGG